MQMSVEQYSEIQKNKNGGNSPFPKEDSVRKSQFVQISLLRDDSFQKTLGIQDKSPAISLKRDDSFQTPVAKSAKKPPTARPKSVQKNKPPVP